MASVRRPDDSKRQAILDAASVDFLERGYDATSIEQIGRRAQVSKVTVYKHFGTKLDLFRAVAKHWVKLIEKDIDISQCPGHAERRLIAASIEIHEVISAPVFIRIERRIASEIQHDPQMGEAYLEATWRKLHRLLVGLLGDIPQFSQLCLPSKALAGEQLLSMIVGMCGLERRFGQEVAQEIVEKRVSAAVRTFLGAYQVLTSSSSITDASEDDYYTSPFPSGPTKNPRVHRTTMSGNPLSRRRRDRTGLSRRDG